MISKHENLIPGEGFTVFRLNGRIGFHTNKDETHNYRNNLNLPFGKELIEEVIINYVRVKDSKNYKHSLSFSWESGSNIIESVKDSTANTKVLVVIGYSFPFFNRDVDREIINNMKGLNKVYFQSLETKNLMERFSALRDNMKDVELIPIDGTEQFILPNEL